MSLQDELKPVAPENYLRIVVSNKAKGQATIQNHTMDL